MESNTNIPDEITFNLLKEFLDNCSKSPIIIEGFPDTVNQAQNLDNLLRSYNRFINNII